MPVEGRKTIRPEVLEEQQRLEKIFFERKGIPLEKFTPNPMVWKHGLGPEEKKCGDCGFLLVKEMRSGKRFFKCSYRGDTNGPGTDQRKKWPSCKLFDQKNGAQEG